MELVGKQLSVLLVAVFCISGLVSGSRDLNDAGQKSLEVRISSAGVVQCWNALTELGSCTNEMVLFFLNGESYLSMDCCRAIRLITHNCWPSMLDSIGFTLEEADVLRGYCDAETATPTVIGAPPAPAPAPAPAPVRV